MRIRRFAVIAKQGNGPLVWIILIRKLFLKSFVIEIGHPVVPHQFEMRIRQIQLAGKAYMLFLQVERSSAHHADPWHHDVCGCAYIFSRTFLHNSG